MSSLPPHVTDHVLLRYVERILEIDIEKIRARIIADVTPAIKVGASRFSKGGMTYVIKENRVVTVSADGSPQVATAAARAAKGIAPHKRIPQARTPRR